MKTTNKNATAHHPPTIPTELPGLVFPCEYPIKAMGRAAAEFSALVIAVITRHAGVVGADQVRVRPSSAGKFQSVTVTVEIASRELLERIYTDLAASQEVLWTL